MTGAEMTGADMTGSEVTGAGMTGDDAPVFPPAAEPTGDASVDGLTAQLSGVPDQPVSEHNAIYTGLHNDLLAELNADPAEDHDTP